MSSAISSTELRLVRLTPRDVTSESDDWRQFRDLVLTNDPSYPGIRKWIDQKVSQGIRSNERVAFLGLTDDIPAASAVVKRGGASKFCHLRLHDGIQDQNVGELLFCLMASEIRGNAVEVHFTLPESLWGEKRDFFQSFGFQSAERASTQYRLFEDELRCSAPFVDVWRSVVQKLPKLARLFRVGDHSMESPLVMSVSPDFAERIFSGRKSVEIRRRFSKKWIGSRTVVYASSPTRTLLGEAVISNVVVDEPDRIWNTFAEGIGCSREEYDAYVARTSEVYAIVLHQIVPYLQPIPITQLELMLGNDLRPPQSYCTTSGDRSWSQAVSLAALLHCSVRPRLT